MSALALHAGKARRSTAPRSGLRPGSFLQFAGESGSGAGVRAGGNFVSTGMWRFRRQRPVFAGVFGGPTGRRDGRRYRLRWCWLALHAEVPRALSGFLSAEGAGINCVGRGITSPDGGLSPEVEQRDGQPDAASGFRLGDSGRGFRSCGLFWSDPLCSDCSRRFNSVTCVCRRKI